MDFRTKITTPPSKFSLTHHTPIMCIGSCFAENIGKKLVERKFQTNINPFGIVYNPISIAKSINYIVENQYFTEKNLNKNGEFWHSFEHHGHFSDLTTGKVLEKINQSLNVAHSFLKNTKILIITLGSATVYELNDSKNIVANCHKFPSHHFTKKRLEIHEIHNVLENALLKLKQMYPEIKIIFTVSPVRHIRDGLIENQRSKATLLLAIDKICNTLKDCEYFPSYEIFNDDLRDYRFCESDMIHPNEQAISYIWEIFEAHYCDANTIKISNEVNHYNKQLAHRPFNLDSTEYKKFKENLNVKKLELSKKYPFLFP